MQAIVKH